MVCLGKFIVNNYRQAISVIATGEPELKFRMQQLSIDSYETFDAWLAEEKQYLLGLKNAPKVNNLAVEYVSTLKRLSAAK